MEVRGQLARMGSLFLPFGLWESNVDHHDWQQRPQLLCHLRNSREIFWKIIYVSAHICIYIYAHTYTCVKTNIKTMNMEDAKHHGNPVKYAIKGI